MSIQEHVDEEVFGSGAADNQPSQETVLISKDNNNKFETITLNRYKNRGWWKRIRKRLCSSHRFKNLQVW